MPRVCLEQVSKSFTGGTVAVDELSLEIADGEFMILVGSSGCGKTTALRMVAGLEKPTSGAIRIGERVVNDVSARDRDIAMVFQNYALYPHMTVARNLAYPLRQRRMPRREIDRRVREVAEMLSLEELLKRRPAQLSGGQRQRVAMGRALVREPEVFLLDEPLSNLDAKLRIQMRAELKRLHARLGITTIYVTHDQVEAMTLGDRLAVISDGKLQQLGDPQEVYDHPANVFVAGFIGSPPMNLLRGRAVDGRVAAGDFVIERPDLPDGELIVGIRPEALTPADGAGPSLDFDVAVVEPLGNELIVHGSVNADIASSPEAGEAALLTRGAARAEVVACLSPRERPAEGSTIRLGVDPAEVHLFDADTGLAIR
ncbi:MAG TPA: sn-glycerol-3-phosphate ABC transporter ATP-binding protein UgpC [Solirubrobacteraceae bacterium]|jgi:multiple sugar transport system ATP-binding protein|nr:sn-glycerol-3-phosphate ABC transporter ATP-binding protein UgpC [Solirubrobacteraceae bacterium]